MALPPAPTAPPARPALVKDWPPGVVTCTAPAPRAAVPAGPLHFSARPSVIDRSPACRRARAASYSTGRRAPAGTDNGAAALESTGAAAVWPNDTTAASPAGNTAAPLTQQIRVREEERQRRDRCEQEYSLVVQGSDLRLTEVSGCLTLEILELISRGSL